MPSTWSTKRERQYEHLRDSARRRGVSSKRAKEFAARTVNKQREQRGETKARYAELSDRTKDELSRRAQELESEGRSRMTTSLAGALEKHE